MRDRSQVELESYRPKEPVKVTLEFCYQQLIRDNKHNIEDEIVDSLTFEELIGALLQCRDYLKLNQK